MHSWSLPYTNRSPISLSTFFGGKTRKETTIMNGIFIMSVLLFVLLFNHMHIFLSNISTLERFLTRVLRHNAVPGMCYKYHVPQSAQTTITKYPTLCGFNHRSFFSHSSRGQTVKKKVPAGLGRGEPLPVGAILGVPRFLGGLQPCWTRAHPDGLM